MKKIGFILLVLVVFSACCCLIPHGFSKRNAYSRVDKNAIVCGVKNPMENLDWLHNIHVKYDSIVHCTDVDYFVRRIYKGVYNPTGDTIICDIMEDGSNDCYVYNCDGTVYDPNASAASHNVDTLLHLSRRDIIHSCSYVRELAYYTNFEWYPV